MKEQKFYHPAFTVLQKEDATTRLAKKNALQWFQTKQVLQAGIIREDKARPYTKRELLTMKSSKLAVLAAKAAIVNRKK